MPDGSAIQKLIDKLDAIITAASHSPLGIVALFLVAIFTIGLILFYRASTKIRIIMFLAMIGSGLAVFIIGLRAVSLNAAQNVVPKQEKLGERTSPLVQQLTYVGRVLDRESLRPVENAEAAIELGQTSKADFTDSTGIYRITFTNVQSNSEARLNITAKGYRPYSLHLPADGATSIQAVRLESLKSTSPGFTVRKATYLGRVLDAESRSPITGAKVTLDALPPTFTDNEGAFWFDLPAQPTRPTSLTVSAKGFEIYELKLDLGNVGPIDVRLQKMKASGDPH